MTAEATDHGRDLDLLRAHGARLRFCGCPLLLHFREESLTRNRATWQSMACPARTRTRSLRFATQRLVAMHRSRGDTSTPDTSLSSRGETTDGGANHRGCAFDQERVSIRPRALLCQIAQELASLGRADARDLGSARPPPSPLFASSAKAERPPCADPPARATAGSARLSPRSDDCFDARRIPPANERNGDDPRVSRGRGGRAPPSSDWMRPSATEPGRSSRLAAVVGTTSFGRPARTAVGLQASDYLLSARPGR
jgi:hypothetical protein